jgi:hypothetical protein
MGLDTNLLYGEMFGSWLIHLSFPVLASVIIGLLPYQPLNNRIWMLLGITVILSAITQFGLLAYLQSAACGGVKDYAPVATGAGIATAITAIMIAIPLFVQPMRLAVSQLFVSHKALLTPQLEEFSRLMAETSIKTGEIVGGHTVEIGGSQTGGAFMGPKPLPPVDYEEQTLKEMMFGASYWAAFAGAYGIGFGSLMNTTCPATSA